MSSLRLRIGTALVVTLLTIALVASLPRLSYAVDSVPQRMVYNSRLLTSDGDPVTTAHTVRFSFWKSADSVSGDFTGANAINTSATNYASWNEEQTVTPDSNGNFYLEMGSSTALPDFASLSAATLASLYLQVEVKPSSSAATAYEILDPQPSDSSIDRSPMLSVPFALNAKMVDQRSPGTGSGSLPVLGSGGVLSKAMMPGGTTKEVFTIDSDATAGSDIVLRFGETLNKVLRYDITNNRFDFNASVNIQGDLTITGLINGVDITDLSDATNTALKVSSGSGLHVSIAAGDYRLNGDITQFAASGSVNVFNAATNYLFFTATGGLVVRTGAFPTNVSFIPLATVTTAGGAVTAVTDRRALQADDREESVSAVLHPTYPDAAYQADGSNNVGQLSTLHDDSSKKNAYQWTSTKTSLQDYTIVTRITLPSQFVRWNATPVILDYKTSSSDTAVAKIDIAIIDTAGNSVTLTGGSSLASTSWTSASITYSGSPTWTAGQALLVKITLSAKDAATAQVGDLTLQYDTLTEQ